MSVDFQGFNEQVCTFIDDDATKAYPVKMSDSASVTDCSDGDIFVGFCTGVRGGYATVQLQGFIRVPFDGTAPDPGYVSLVADGDGGVREADADDDEVGRTVLLVTVEEDTVGIIF